MDTLTQKDIQDKFAKLIATNIAVERAKRRHANLRTYETALDVQAVERQRDELHRLIPKPTLVN